MASNYGVPVVIDQDGVVLDVQSTAVSTVGGGSGELQKMSPMETMQEVFFEIRDGINQIVDTMAEGLELEKERFRKEGLAGQNKAIVSGNTDPEPKATGGDGGILKSLLDALSGLGGAGKGLLGIAALIATMVLFNALSDTFVKLLTPVLEFLGETLIPNIKELNEIIMSHPGGYFTLLGAIGLVATLGEVFGVKGSLNKLFTSISNFARTAFIDDIDFRTKIGKTWAGRISRAIYGTKSGRGGLIPGLNRAIRGLGNSLRTIFYPDEFFKVLKTTADGWRASIASRLGIGKGSRIGGILGRVSRVFSRMGSAIRGIFSFASVTKALGVIKRITRRFGRIMARIGRTVTKALGFVSKISGLSTFLRLGLAFAKAIPIVGQIILVVQGLFGFVKGAIEGYKTGGILGAITGAFIGLYDAVFASLANLIADILGWIFTKLGLKGLGTFFSNLDFSFDSIKSAVLSVVDGIRYVFWAVSNGMKKAYNGITSGINRVAKYIGIELEPYKLTPFVPMKRPEEPIPEEPPAENPLVKSSGSAMESLETSRAGIKPVSEDMSFLTSPDLGSLNAGAAPVFAPMTGGTTNVANTTTAFPLNSTHQDSTATSLTEVYAE